MTIWARALQPVDGLQQCVTYLISEGVDRKHIDQHYVLGVGQQSSEIDLAVGEHPPERDTHFHSLVTHSAHPWETQE